MRGHNQQVEFMAISSHGNVIMLGSQNKKLRIWEKNQIIDIDKNGKEAVIATADVNVFDGPGSDIYFSHYSDPFEVVR